MNRIGPVASLVVAVLCAASALAQTPPAPSTAPAPSPALAAARRRLTTVVRWNEDYSYLSDAPRTDLWDPIKYIPLNDAGDWYLSLGGQARYRYELFNNNNFGAGPQDDTGFHLIRLLAHADLHLGQNLRGFVQGRAPSRTAARRARGRPTTTSSTSSRRSSTSSSRSATRTSRSRSAAGARTCSYGAQRLICPLDWTNVRRTFDGGKASVAVLQDALARRVLRPPRHRRERGAQLDATRHQSSPASTTRSRLPNVPRRQAATKLDLYGLYLDRDRLAGFPPRAPATRTATPSAPGSRHDPKPFDLDVEAAYQFGDVRRRRHLRVDGRHRGRLHVRRRAARRRGCSSASTPPAATTTRGDGDLETFNQLFPPGHPYFGYIDLSAARTSSTSTPASRSTSLRTSATRKKMTLRASTTGSGGRATTTRCTTPPAPCARRRDRVDETFVGSEIDLLLNWQIDRHLAAYFGYSHFFAGDFIEETGPDEDIDFVYAAVTYTF